VGRKDNRVLFHGEPEHLRGRGGAGDSFCFC
jgi:hypothetical protein